MKSCARRVVSVLLAVLAGSSASSASQSQLCGEFSCASGPDPSGDLPFQGPLCGRFLEEDFETQVNGASVPQLLIGQITVDVNLVDGQGNLLADDASIFASGAFNVSGVMLHNALLNRNGLSSVIGRIEFVFTPPVESFGAWMFDDFGSDDPITVEVIEVGGAFHVKGPMNLSTGTGIEGFFGFHSCVGIERVRVGIASSFLELD